MTSQIKKWVFTELVKDPNNLEQLLSYAIYKGFKDERAQTSRKEGKNEVEIESILSDYHDQCLHSAKQLEVFRNDARKILDGYVSSANTGLLSGMENLFSQQEVGKNKEIETLKKKLKAAEKDALKKVMAGAEEYSKKITKLTGLSLFNSYTWKFINFLFSGVPKLFATAFSVGLIFSIYAAFSSDATTAARTGIFKMVNTFLPAHSEVSDISQPDAPDKNP